VPPLGAIHWVVTKASNGAVVDAGNSPAFAAQTAGYDGEKVDSITWIGLGASFKAEAGGRYVVELNIQQSQVPLDPFHPRLKVESPWVGP
jgi:hypothetical protein